MSSQAVTHDVIPYARQSIDENDVDAVVAVLRSDSLTQGEKTPEFERALTEYCGSRYGYAVANGTVALHLACLALGVGPDSRVWTTPITFVASANAARYCGAEVDFVDIDPRSWNISVSALEAKIARDGAPDVLIAVDFTGRPCDWDALRSAADKYGFKIIQDAAHSLGSIYKGCRAGGVSSVDITTFSFHPVKVLTTGEGGFVLTQNPEYAQRLNLLRNHGITRDPAEFTAPADGAWVYEQQLLGFNARLTDIQAALGLSQLGRLDAFLARRQELACQYDAALQPLQVQGKLTLPPPMQAGVSSAWHLYPVLLRDVAERARVFEAMREAGIGVQVHYTAVHLQPYYRQLGFAEGHCPVAEDYARRCLSLPLFPDLSDAQQRRVVATLFDLV